MMICCVFLLITYLRIALQLHSISKSPWCSQTNAHTEFISFTNIVIFHIAKIEFLMPDSFKSVAVQEILEMRGFLLGSSRCLAIPAEIPCVIEAWLIRIAYTFLLASEKCKIGYYWRKKLIRRVCMRRQCEILPLCTVSAEDKPLHSPLSTLAAFSPGSSWLTAHKCSQTIGIQGV